MQELIRNMFRDRPKGNNRRAKSALDPQAAETFIKY